MLSFGRETFSDHRLMTIEKHTKYEAPYFENFLWTLFNPTPNVDTWEDH